MYEEYRIGEITMSDRTDYISRQAAIDALHGYFDGMLETDTWSPCDVYGLIEIMPSARARWEYVDYGGVGNWHCSKCRAIGSKSYKYCPNCGAIMDKPTD